jgi:REP element-mobilizing transposase RayT
VFLREDGHEPFQRLTLAAMSLHSYSRCWLHLIWGTLNREKILPKEAASRVSNYLTDYAKDKGFYMKINYVNADHVHTLIDLPTGLSIEELMQLLKGKFFSLDQRKQCSAWKIRVGTRLRCVLCLGIQCWPSRYLHCRPGGTSPCARIR